MNGWIKLHKKIIENEIWKYDQTAWHVFEGLLALADTKTGNWRGGRYHLAELVNVNPNTLKDAINRLKAQQMITSSSTSKYTVYHICNWGKYQHNDTTYDTNKTPAKHQQNTTIKRNKEIKKDITNVISANPEIDSMFNYWYEKTGLEIYAKQKANRYACSNLIKKYGVDKLRRLIDGVALSQGDQYAPRIADFTQLQSKTNELLLWGKKNNNNKVEVIS